MFNNLFYSLLVKCYLPPIHTSHTIKVGSMLVTNMKHLPALVPRGEKKKKKKKNTYVAYYIRLNIQYYNDLTRSNVSLTTIISDTWQHKTRRCNFDILS